MSINLLERSLEIGQRDSRKKKPI